MKLILWLGALFAHVSLFAAAHVYEIPVRIWTAEEGFVIGNGDFSCSVYENADDVVFRFGKNDVWDRRLDFSDTPKPATQREFIDGVLKEGWKSNALDGKGTVATKGTKNEKRMKEICQGTSPATKHWPYPCPKPTGELRINLPVDQPGPAEWQHRLFVEEGRVEVRVKWASGVEVVLDAVIAPDEDVFSLGWEVKNYHRDTALGSRQPVWFKLHREADPDPREWAERHFAATLNPLGRYDWAHGKAQPLPPPIARKDGNGSWIEQRFYPEDLHPDGFRCRLTMAAPAEVQWREALGSLRPDVAAKDAWVVFMPQMEARQGELVVKVTTTPEGGRAADNVIKLITPEKTHAEYVAAAAKSAADFWAQSSLSLPDEPVAEKLWYTMGHARRCILKGGKVPPGLFFPSTVDHFSHWHGDYHSNYNFESIYWGVIAANHPELAEAWFDTMDWYARIGRKIAKDYWGCRGVVIPLEGFPVAAADDYSGCLPLGRMVYMTGWAVSCYREYYRATMDDEWLKRRGYPMMRDCALFYLDYLKRAPSPDLPPQLNDGLYHAFPSGGGEDGFNGDPMDVCDRSSCIRYARHALFCAIEAAEHLGVDKELRTQWLDRLRNLANDHARGLKGLALHCALVCPPQFGTNEGGIGLPYQETHMPAGFRPYHREQHEHDKWCFGHVGRVRTMYTRTNRFWPEREWAAYMDGLKAWMRPNGLCTGMAIGNIGRAGAWTECLSLMNPLQENLLQSWDGAINLFPWWDKRKPATFTDWRADGAFLVSAACAEGKVTSASIRSLKGCACHVYGNWQVFKRTGDAAEEAVATDRDRFGRLRFKTTAGACYVLKGSGK